MTVGAHTRILALVGHPVRHSLSPAMYNALFPRFGIDAVYVALDVAPERAPRLADAIRTLGVVGVNLTVPFKEAVLPHLDHLTPAAREAGAANVVINEHGVLTGYNTDGEGLVRSLEEGPGGLRLRGREAVILGTGGTGRAVAAAFLERGVRRVSLLNRTVPRAEATAEALRRAWPEADVRAGPLEPDRFRREAPGATLVVNCTAGEAAGRIAGLDPSPLPDGATWVDVNYWMAHPPHEDLAREGRLGFRTGHAMLAHQAALAFELFTGHPVRAAAILELLAAGGAA